MIAPNPRSPPAAFNRFLYARVGDDNNGMDLTLLSALARQNVDAWQKAAELSLLPAALATQMLAELLIAALGHLSLMERTALAGRLILLLQNPFHDHDIGAGSGGLEPAPVRPERTSALTLVLIYFTGMVICGWFFSDPMPPQSAAKSVPASITAAPARPTSISRGH